MLLDVLDAFGASKVVRSPIRFARKYWAAHLLNARMFQGHKAAEEVLSEINNTSLVKHGDQKMKELMKLDTHFLQQWVRASCQSDHNGNAQYKLFLSSVVKPCLMANVSSIPANIHDIIGRVTAIVQGDQASEEDQVCLKLACSAMKGEFTNHPLLCGLALSCSRMMEKQSRNIFTMAGRRSLCSEREAELISDAGQQLACATGNVALAREFGLSSRAGKVNQTELQKNSLPTPTLAVRWPQVLQDNFNLADQRFVKAAETPVRSFDLVWKFILFGH